MRKLIISLGVNGRENYVEKQKGLIKTLHIAKDAVSWVLNEYPEGVTPHTVTPYKFKFDLIKLALEEDFYTHICWADSSMKLLKDPFELLEQSEKGIVAFGNIGHPAWKYTTKVAEDNLSYCFDDIKEVKQTWGGFVMFDFTKPLSRIILSEILHQAEIGSFEYGTNGREGFVDARNDQTVMSYLFHFYKIPLLEYGIIAAKPHVTDKTYIQYGN